MEKKNNLNNEKMKVSNLFGQIQMTEESLKRFQKQKKGLKNFQ